MIASDSSLRLRAAVLAECGRLSAEERRFSIAEVAGRLGISERAVRGQVRALRRTGQWPESAAAKVFGEHRPRAEGGNPA